MSDMGTHTHRAWTRLQTFKHAYIQSMDGCEEEERTKSRWRARVPFLFSALMHHKQALFCDSRGKSDKNADIYIIIQIQCYTLILVLTNSARRNEQREVGRAGGQTSKTQQFKDMLCYIRAKPNNKQLLWVSCTCKPLTKSLIEIYLFHYLLSFELNPFIIYITFVYVYCMYLYVVTTPLPLEIFSGINLHS